MATVLVNCSMLCRLVNGVSFVWDVEEEYMTETRHMGFVLHVCLALCILIWILLMCIKACMKVQEKTCMEQSYCTFPHIISERDGELREREREVVTPLQVSPITHVAIGSAHHRSFACQSRELH